MGSESGVEVLQIPSELAEMVALYQERKPGRVLEIGCWDGGTLRVWLEESTPELVVAVDLEHSQEARYPAWCGPGTDLRVITGNSQHPDIQALIAGHGPYDWVFIDGDHGNSGVRVDVETCRPLVRAGGLMVLHDIVPEAGLRSYPPGDIVREFAAAGFETREIVDPEPAPWAHGIGVVQL